MSDAVAAWSDSLDSLEALVDRQRRYVAGEAGAPTDEWSPPADALPVELRPRAILLQHETRMLTIEIQRRLVGAPDPRTSPYT